VHMSTNDSKGAILHVPLARYKTQSWLEVIIRSAQTGGGGNKDRFCGYDDGGLQGISLSRKKGFFQSKRPARPRHQYRTRTSCPV